MCRLSVDSLIHHGLEYHQGLLCVIAGSTVFWAPVSERQSRRPQGSWACNARQQQVAADASLEALVAFACEQVVDDLDGCAVLLVTVFEDGIQSGEGGVQGKGTQVFPHPFVT